MRKLFRRIIAAAAAALCGPAFAAPADGVARYAFEVVAEYPHDAEAFTQGLFFLDGRLYEGTGLVGRSTLREVELETGKVLRRRDLPPHVFGEGVAPWRDKIVALTWRNGEGYVFARKGFKKLRAFSYPGEGWGLTADGARLIMSDGTSALRFLDPETLTETGRVEVTFEGKPLARLNELEYVDGAVFANVWQTNAIVRIDPATGVVTGVVDMRGLRQRIGDAPNADVLNGIAWDAKKKRLFVTGKNWPKLFEVRLVPMADTRPPSPQ